MAVRVLTADRTGKILAELDGVTVGPVSWRLNAVGRAEFIINKNDAKATQDNLNFGNRILLEFDNGLPYWGGVIDTPRQWNDTTIKFTAYTGEYLLGFRQTGIVKAFSGADVGSIFTEMLADANAVSLLGITMGTAWSGGDGYSPEFHHGNLLEKMQNVVFGRLSTADFCIVPGESAGYVTLTAYVYDTRGSTKAGVALIESHNLTNILLNEQGPIVNSWAIVGKGTEWSVDRLEGTAEDTTSIEAYGRREAFELQAEQTEQTAVDNIAANRLATHKDPRSILKASATNDAPALFADYDVGDTISVLLHSYGFGGFDASIRVLTREYNPSAETCTLVFEEA
jgi:hypothetical protein